MTWQLYLALSAVTAVVIMLTDENVRRFGMGWYLNIVTVVMFSLCWWLYWGMLLATGLGIAFNVLNRIFRRRP